MLGDERACLDRTYAPNANLERRVAHIHVHERPLACARRTLHCDVEVPTRDIRRCAVNFLRERLFVSVTVRAAEPNKEDILRVTKRWPETC